MAPPHQSSLNVIALVSGGKDSLYSLLHCLRNGHRVVALANLYPDSPGGPSDNDDIDSFMYQTIGYGLIPLYETALGIPLYREKIAGSTVDGGKVYGVSTRETKLQPAGEDETESLVPLLKRIKLAHPEANAVSAGAILSTYQRTRIEHVAARLGLIPLAWLWLYPFLPPPAERSGAAQMCGDAGLLEDMASAGCEARIIKVASGGLDRGFLWGDVSGLDPEMRRRLIKNMKPFAEDGDVRGAVLGEGGEYETLALDGPGLLWKQRIEVTEKLTRSAEGGVEYLKLMGAKCVPKKEPGRLDIRLEDVRVPALLDEVFANALEELSASFLASGEKTGTNEAAALDWNELRLGHYDGVHARDGTFWTISNIAVPEAGCGVSEQIERIVDKMRTMLESTCDQSTDDIVFATILLRSMADLAAVNTSYASLFPKPNPPARVTVACGSRLPENVKVMVSFIIGLGPRDLWQGLHVQSRSYWAPASIGPYSQAVSIPVRGAAKLVYVAGQIPLDPASMEIANKYMTAGDWCDSYLLHAVLSLQHLWRVGAEIGVGWWLGAVVFLAGEDRIDTKVHMAWRLWKKIHTREDEKLEEDVSELDAWDIKYGGRIAEQKASHVQSSSLPNFSLIRPTPSTPPFLAVQVEELPKGSDIEWQGLGCQCDWATIAGVEGDYIRSFSTTIDGLTYTAVEIDMVQPGLISQYLQEAIKAHYLYPYTSAAVLYTALSLPNTSWPGQIVPCTAVWGREGRILSAGILFQTMRDSN